MDSGILKVPTDQKWRIEMAIEDITDDPFFVAEHLRKQEAGLLTLYGNRYQEIPEKQEPEKWLFRTIRKVKKLFRRE